MKNFFSILFISIFIENALFMRALGTRRMLVLINKPKKLYYFGLFIILINVIHTSFVWFFNFLFNQYKFYYLLIPLIFILCMSLAYTLIYMILKVFFKDFLDKNLNLLISSTFNTLIFGTLLLNFSHSYKLTESLIFGIGSQIGFMMSTLLVIEGNRRLQISKVPKAFKGLPITLIYIGILSLAFYGLVGHMLPSKL
ncbi:MAG: hypothetical protein J6C55_04400 [Oscillospiraceae bacterium]|nr:hypothetical protein [Oscillospiraceae bacterium]